MAITITVISGTGYFGSVYQQSGAVGAGQWYADGNPISGATANTYTLTAENEGKTITFRDSTSESNRIKLWTPKQLHGLVAWFDASRLDLITLVTGRVSVWNSKIGSMWAEMATAGTRPTFSTTGRNGKPAVIADGVTQHLELMNTGALPTGLANIFGVAFYTNVNPAAYRMLIKWGSVATARYGIAKSNLERVAMIGGNASTNTPSNVNWPGADHIFSGQFEGSGGAELIVDGQHVVNNVNVFNTPDQGAAYIFRDATAYWNGSAQEICIFNRNLSGDERQSLEGYIASKWGLRGNLPVGHPYKTTNPPIVGYGAIGILGGLVGSGVLATPIPAVVSGVLGQLVGSGTLSLVRYAQVAAELQGLVGAGTLTSFKNAQVNGVLSALVGESEITSEESIEVAAILGALRAEGAFTVESSVTVDAVLGALLGEATVIVPSPMTGDIELGGLVASAEATAYGPAEVDVTLGELVGESEITAVASQEPVVEGILEMLVGSSILAQVQNGYLIVEDGTIVPNANSYATLSWIDNYLFQRQFTDWHTSSAGDRNAAIIRATIALDAIYGSRYPGTKVQGRTQSLKWPRKDATDVKGYDIAIDEIPIEIKKALAEAAYLEWQTPGYLQPNWTPDQLVTSETLGPLSVSYSDPSVFGPGGNQPKLSKIDGILAPLLAASTSLYFGETERA